MRFLIKDATVIPMVDDEPQWFVGSVMVEDGVIVDVVAVDEGAHSGAMGDLVNWSHADYEVIDGRGKLVLPGFVNAHTHVAMTLMRNLADDTSLMTWLNDHVWPFEEKLTPEDIARGARLGIEEMLRGGTTTMVDMYWHEAAIARVADEMGIRAVLCPSFVDSRMEAFENDLAATLDVVRCSDRLQVMIAPHAAYSCSPENLRRAVHLAREHDLGIHIHVSETRDEQEIIMQRHGCTPVEYLNSLGLFDVPAMAAHCVFVSDNDISVLFDKGVTVVHNPQSNMKLASGAAPVARMLQRGLNVAVGTDGAASNNDLDMWDEGRSAALLGKLTAGDPAVMSAYEVLRMMTVGGAEAIGMGDRIGKLVPGYAADIQMVDVLGAHWQPLHNPISAAIYSAKSSDVHSVWVGGRKLL